MASSVSISSSFCLGFSSPASCSTPRVTPTIFATSTRDVRCASSPSTMASWRRSFSYSRSQLLSRRCSSKRASIRVDSGPTRPTSTSLRPVVELAHLRDPLLVAGHRRALLLALGAGGLPRTAGNAGASLLGRHRCRSGAAHRPGAGGRQRAGHLGADALPHRHAMRGSVSVCRRTPRGWAADVARALREGGARYRRGQFGSCPPTVRWPTPVCPCSTRSATRSTRCSSAR